MMKAKYSYIIGFLAARYTSGGLERPACRVRHKKAAGDRPQFHYLSDAEGILLMEYFDPLTVLEVLDMEEQQLLLTCLLMALGTEKTYEIAMQTVAMLKNNHREEVALMLEEAAGKMTV
jgi:hypothetical protein